MLYTKRDIPQLQRQADDKNLGASIRQYYKDCIAEIRENGKVDTARMKERIDGDES
jgi:hypothetical protein